MLSKRRQILIKNIRVEIEELGQELIENLDNEILLNPKLNEERYHIAASISYLKDACEELDEALKGETR